MIDYLNKKFKRNWRILFVSQWLTALALIPLIVMDCEWWALLSMILCFGCYFLRTMMYAKLTRPIKLNDILSGMEGKRKRNVRRGLMRQNVIKKIVE